MDKKRRMKTIDRVRLAVAVAVSVGGLSPVPAMAQDADSTRAGPSLTIEEVIVTAREKSESLQDIPMSVTAFSGEMLADSGYTDMSALGAMTPGLHFEAFDATRPLIYVRGIGTRAYDAGSDPSVGVFVDGAYNGRFGSLNMSLLDVERIEVLKPPIGS